MSLTITIIEATPAVLTIGVGTPGATGPQGPQGIQGPQGPQGDPGQPGEGVPAGGLASQVLAKIDGQDFNTEWVDQSGAVVWGDIGGDLINQGDLVSALADKLDVTTAASTYYLQTNPSGFITSAALTSYATQSWVTSGFYPLTGNPSGFITSAALSAYLSKAGNLSGLTSLSTARDNLNLGTSNTPVFAGVTAQGSGANVAQLTPTSLTLTQPGDGIFTIQPSQGIVFPNGTIQTTAYPGPVGATQWGSITGSLINQTDLYNSLAAKLDSTTAASTYAVIAAGQPTAGTVGQVLTKNSGTNYDSSWATLIPGDRYLTSSTTSLTIDNANKTLTVGTGLSYTPQQDVVIAYDASNHMHAQVLTYNSGTGVMTVDVQTHTGTGTFAAWTVNVGGTVPVASIVWGDITGTLGNQTDLATALNSKLELSGGALDANASVTASDTSTATDSELAGWGLGVQVTADHTKGTTVEFDGLDVYDGASHMTVTPTGLTFPDATVQSTAYTGGGGGGTWGSITGTLSNQTDLQSALDSKYDVTNPAGFITFGDLTGYATESWVTGQGYITSGYLANIQTDIGFDTSIGTPQTQRLFLDGVCELTPGSGITQARLNFSSNSHPNSPVNGDMWVNHTYGLNVVWGGITNLMATQIWVNGNLNLKASLSGATFTGKVNLATLGVATPSVNLGGQCDSAPASASNGDIWISNAVAPKLTYRMGGVNYNLPVLNQFNTFTNQMVIDTASSSTAALRVTQRGAGNAIEVEDSTTPDATKFVVDQFGKVGVGTAPDATAAIKIDGNGISFNGLVFNPTATAAHTISAATADLLITINGVNYRIDLRPA